MPSSQSGSVREKRRDREAELRRADVIAAASVVFGEKGFQGAQVAEIANTAELSLNSVYALFKGKEELYEAVLYAAAATIRDEVQAKAEALSDPADQLLSIIDTLFACFDDHRDLMRIYARATSGLPWRVREAMGEDSFTVLQEFTAWLVSVAQRASKQGSISGIDPETLALSLIGTITTSASRWIEDPKQESLAKAAPRVRSLFEHLIASENS
ncbi:MAG: TetR/AcrR family transcriptional regulator [Deltaproteobacteria bacterium]|nr:TetR/AcrR family transcriptional regulator [Deltaproteobacteria bacterium]MBW2397000.1 TetR/AcrR family transcriptional regulator [Deltaproteobacteria bacterium]